MKESEVEMPLEIFGNEFECIVKFDYSPFYRGDPGRFGKEGRIDWGTPEEPEEYEINELIIKTKVSCGPNLTANEYNDVSFLLDSQSVVEHITQFLKDNKE